MTDPVTEERILEAAHAVFLRRGTAGARTQEIADEAGVNKALLHYYFRSKERLAEAVFERAAKRLMPPILETMASDLPLETKVERVIQHELEVLLETPDLPGYLVSEMHHHPERVEQFIAGVIGSSPSERGEAILAKLREQLDDAARRGTMREIAPEQFLVNLISLCVFPFAARPMISAVLGRSGEGFRALIEDRQRSLAAFFLNALRP